MTLDRDALAQGFDLWLENIAHNHGAANHRGNPEPVFHRLRRPLAEAQVALVSTAGVHLDDQEPFDVSTTSGDPSYRLIPDDVDTARLRFTHTHYDTSAAQADPNVVFPLDRLHEAVAAGRVGTASPIHIGLMGFNPDPTEVAETTAPAVAADLAEAGTDVVVLVPG